MPREEEGIINETYDDYKKMRSECHELVRRTKYDCWERLRKSSDTVRGKKKMNS
jgi:acyl-CoA-binding protein